MREYTKEELDLSNLEPESESERITRLKLEEDEKWLRRNGKPRNKFPSNLTPKKKKRKR